MKQPGRTGARGRLARGGSGSPLFASGISGFDAITGGGLPEGRVTVVLGGAGSGKTIFALQCLATAARDREEPGVFVAFEESPAQILANVSSFPWRPSEGSRKGVHFLDAKLTESVVQGGEFDLMGLLAVLGAKCKQARATHVALDGIDVLLDHLNDPALVRRECFRLREWLLAGRLTALVTAKADGDGGRLAAGYEFLEFMSDCVVTMRHRVVSGTAVRTVRVSKLRGSPHSANEIPFTIDATGIAVAAVGSGELSYPVSGERVTTGVERLDGMLSGGYYRGSSVLLTGAPGTAKTSLSAAFAEASCQRGERTLYVSFDEGPEQIVRNVASVGIKFAPHVRSGLLALHSLRARSSGAEGHVAQLRSLIAQLRPQALIIDPISALQQSLDEEMAAQAALQIIDVARQAGITLVSTSLLGSAAPYEQTPIAISTVADTWIHVTYVAQGGERNRALTVVKSRGMAHSNQVRELILSKSGISLTDVYSAGGSVLMGTLRWEKENEERHTRYAERITAEQEERRAHLTLSETRARLQSLTIELDVHEAELARAQAARRGALARGGTERTEVLRLRGADASLPRAARGARPR